MDPNFGDHFNHWHATLNKETSIHIMPCSILLKMLKIGDHVTIEAEEIKVNL
jgi:hypothetical protein